MRRLILLLVITGVTGRLLAQSCNLTPNSIAINALCSSLQATLNTGNATLSARDHISLQPGFSITSANLNGHTFTAKIDNSVANQLNSYESTSVNGTIPALDKNSCIPGTIGGSIDVSPSGAATYQLPIQVSPGSHGMQPNLSIVYSSQGGRGLLGWGWNLGGISTISRSGKTPYYDGKFEPATLYSLDVLSMDGVRLIKASTDNYYPENNPYTKVVFSNNSFTVTTQGGMVMEYGLTVNARVMPQDQTSQPYAWAISRITDPDKNYIDFIYTGDYTYGEHRISEIRYTGNSGYGKSPYNSVKFYYDKSNDISTKRVDENTELSHIFQTVILTGIKVFSEGALANEYKFDYFYDQYSKLSKISYTANGAKFNPTYVRWGESSSYQTTRADLPPGATAQLWGTNSKSDLLFGDFNGDGRTDIARFDFDNRSITFGIAILTGGYSIYTISLPADISETGTYEGLGSYGLYRDTLTYKKIDVKIADYNSDGRDELMFHYSYFHHYIYTPFSGPRTAENTIVFNDTEDAYSFNGSGFTPTRNFCSVRVPYTDIHTKFFYGDINNDGITERFIVDTKILNYSSIPTSPAYIADVESIQFVDYDGDGQVEAMVYTDHGTEIIKYNGNALVRLTSGGASLSYSFSGDFNGDGKIDYFFGAYDDNGNPEWSTSCRYTNGTINAPSIIRSTYPNSEFEVHTADINNDGRDEILFINNNIIYIFELVGNSFVTLGTIAVDCLHFRDTFLDIPANNYLSTVDLNGDGQKEIVYGNNSATLPYRYITFNSRLDRGLYVNTITDGLGNTSTITYNTFADNRTFSTSFPKPAFPLNLFRGPSRVVGNLTTANGSTTTANVSYTYADAYTHIAGRGFLGFKTLTSSNSTNGISSSSNFSYEIPNAPGIYSTWLTSQTTSKGGIVSSVTNTMEAKKLDITKKSFVPVITSSATIDYLKCLTTTSTTTFDESIGRATSQTVSAGGWTIASSTQYTTVSGYITRPYIATTTRTNGTDTYTNTVTFGYDGTNPMRMVSKFESEKGITTNYSSFDSFGNAQGVSVTSRNTTRIGSKIFDDKGRFAISSTDASNFTSTATYRPTDGAILTQIDPNGLTTTHSYSSPGNSLVATTTLPDGNVVTKTLGWDTDNASQYFTREQVTNGNTVTAYYNLYGQEVKETSLGFKPTTPLATNYTYNADGSLHSKGSAGFNDVIYTYDSRGRLDEVNDGYTIKVKHSYSCSSGYSETVTDNYLGSYETKTFDALGNVTNVTGTNGGLTYTYFASGKVKSITNALGGVTEMTYDAQGNQLTLSDPDAGLSTFTYNGFNQLLTQQDAKSQTITLSYDGGGRLLSKSGAGISETYTYFNTPGKLGLLQNVNRNDNVFETYSYDNLGRPTTQVVTGAGKTFTTTNLYNSLGRLEHVIYSTGLTVEYSYDGVGNLEYIYNDADKSKAIWEGYSKNAREQWTEYRLGNNLSTKWGYNDNTYTLSSIKTGTSGNETGIQNLGFTYNSKGQLETRTDNSLSESFGYDALNRLTSSTVTGQETVSFGYQDNGNISSTSLAGTYTYNVTGKPHAVGSIAGPAGTTGQSPSIVTNSTFTGDNQINTMDNGTYRNAFTYGPSGNRFRVEHKQGSITVYSKIYVGNSEFLYSSAEEQICKRTMISTPTGICAVYQDSLGVQSMHYIHTDNQGSWVKITSTGGAVENSYSYDAWGRPRDPNTWVLKPISTADALVNLNAMQPRFDRGYTGHEHMAGFGLINMNGRLYDPYLQRFLSPDNYVANPLNAQSYNRYSYCLNNPLAYTDPSGWYPQDYAAYIQSLAAGGSGGLYEFGKRDVNIWSGLPAMNSGYMGYTSLDNGKYIDNATGKTVDYSVVYNNYVEPNTTPGTYTIKVFQGMGSWKDNQTAIVTNPYGLVEVYREFEFISTSKPSGQGGTPWYYGIPGVGPALESGDNLGRGNYCAAAAAFGMALVDVFTLGGATAEKAVIKTGTNVVYQGIDAAGVVRYIGITERNAAVRFGEHAVSTGTGREFLRYEVIDGATGLSRIDARIWEQNLINQYGLGRDGGLLLNKINSIAPKNWSMFGIYP